MALAPKDIDKLVGAYVKMAAPKEPFRTNADKAREAAAREGKLIRTEKELLARPAVQSLYRNEG